MHVSTVNVSSCSYVYIVEAITATIIIIIEKLINFDCISFVLRTSPNKLKKHIQELHVGIRCGHFWSANSSFLHHTKIFLLNA